MKAKSILERLAYWQILPENRRQLFESSHPRAVQLDYCIGLLDELGYLLPCLDVGESQFVAQELIDHELGVTNPWLGQLVYEPSINQDTVSFKNCLGWLEVLCYADIDLIAFFFQELRRSNALIGFAGMEKINSIMRLAENLFKQDHVFQTSYIKKIKNIFVVLCVSHAAASSSTLLSAMSLNNFQILLNNIEKLEQPILYFQKQRLLENDQENFRLGLLIKNYLVAEEIVFAIEILMDFAVKGRHTINRIEVNRLDELINMLLMAGSNAVLLAKSLIELHTKGLLENAKRVDARISALASYPEVSDCLVSCLEKLNRYNFLNGNDGLARENVLLGMAAYAYYVDVALAQMEGAYNLEDSEIDLMLHKVNQLMDVCHPWFYLDNDDFKSGSVNSEMLELKASQKLVINIKTLDIIFKYIGSLDTLIDGFSLLTKFGLLENVKNIDKLFECPSIALAVIGKVKLLPVDVILTQERFDLMFETIELESIQELNEILCYEPSSPDESLPLAQFKSLSLVVPENPCSLEWKVESIPAAAELRPTPVPLSSAINFGLFSDIFRLTPPLLSLANNPDHSSARNEPKRNLKRRFSLGEDTNKRVRMRSEEKSDTDTPLNTALGVLQSRLP